jgi:hypothetical protein
VTQIILRHHNIQHNVIQRNNKLNVTFSIIVLVLFMQSVSNQPFMHSVIMLNVTMLSAVVLNVVEPIIIVVVNLVTPKVAAKHKHLSNKPDYGYVIIQWALFFLPLGYHTLSDACFFPGMSI